MIRPAWWVFFAGLGVAAVSLLAPMVRRMAALPSRPARRTHPATADAATADAAAAGAAAAGAAAD